MRKVKTRSLYIFIIIINISTDSVSHHQELTSNEKYRYILDRYLYIDVDCVTTSITTSYVVYFAWF